MNGGIGNGETTSARANMAGVMPTIEHFDDDEFRERHRVVLFGYGAISLLALTLGFKSFVAGSDSFSHFLVESLLALLPAVGMLTRPPERIVQAVLAVSGILIGCGLTVHATGGLIESHFSFFVVIPLIALYTDWRPFFLAVLYVALGHGVVGAIDPSSMYNHDAAINSPFVWGLIHAAYVVALTAVMLVHWHFTDRRRVQLKDALRDLQSAQDRLHQAEKLEAIGSLAAGVAHEINTPVQFVTDNLQFMRETSGELTVWSESWLAAQESAVDGQPTAEALAEVSRIYAETDIQFGLEEMPPAIDQCLEGMERVSEIVRSMKNFSHPSDEVVPSDLNDLIRSTATVSRAEWKYVAELELALDEDLPQVPVPPGSFNQAILNMIVNAAHAISDRADLGSGEGRITVATRSSGDFAFVSVSDNGAGIPEAIRTRVFDQFFTTKDIGRGTGQGLAIVHTVVSELGGSIELESEVGVGTTFTLVLPRTAAASTDDSAEWSKERAA